MMRFNGMTGRELLERLEELSDEDLELPVGLISNYGDYSRTQQVLAIDDIRGAGKVVESGYSHSGFALPYNAGEEPDEETEADLADNPSVLLIQSRER